MARLAGSDADAGPARLPRTAPDDGHQAFWKLLGTERRADVGIDAVLAQHRRHGCRIQQDVVVPLIVAAPPAVREADEGGHLTNEPIRPRDREPGDEHPALTEPDQVGRVPAGLAPS